MMSEPCPCIGKHCRLDTDDPRHGTTNGYSNLSCRCRPCRDAWAAYYREGRGKVAMRKYQEKLRAQGLTLNGAPRKHPFRPRRSGEPRPERRLPDDVPGSRTKPETETFGVNR